MGREDEIVTALTRSLSDFPELRFAVLYGSVARSTMHTQSDIDLGIAKDPRTAIDTERLLDISLACTREAGREVQVRDLARADGLFLKQVLTEGKVIVNRDPAVRAELIIRMLDFTEDMLPNIRMMRAAAIERFVAGDRSAGS